jgi:hypothetical protein
VEALRRADHSSKESYRLCIDQETEKRPGPTRAVEPLKNQKMEGVINVYFSVYIIRINNLCSIRNLFWCTLEIIVYGA